MKSKLAVIYLAFCIFCIFQPMLGQTTAVPPATGTPGQQSIQNFRAVLAQRTAESNKWQEEADWEIGLTIAVIVFGAIVTVVQGSKDARAKTATVVLGLAITIITGVDAKVFPADYKTLQKASQQQNEAIVGLQAMLDEQDATLLSGQSLADFNASFLKALNPLDDIENQVLAKATNRGGLEPVVYAQSATQYRPPWVTSPPSDGHSLYFVGIASAANLADAKNSSLTNAIARASASLAHGKAASDPLKTLVQQSGSTQNTFFNLDPKTKTYTYYTLFRLSNEIVGVVSAMKY